MAGPHHRDPRYRRLAPAIRAAAAADPTTRCWRCGRTLEEHPPGDDGKPPTWTAGHVIDGDPASPIRAEASTCNHAAGGKTGARRRATGYDWP